MGKNQIEYNYVKRNFAAVTTGIQRDLQLTGTNSNQAKWSQTKSSQVMSVNGLAMSNDKWFH